ncbi:MAG: hypothetical protein SFV23_24265 [Planctomycetaceae bacterium]|nr:hypothetical protein [Planctomycetaceae bacterium]
MPQPSASAPPKTSAVPPPRTWRERLFRPRILILLAGLSTLPVLGPWLVRQLPNLEERPEYRLPFAHLQLEPPAPGDLPADFLEQVRQRGNLDVELSVLSPELPRKLAEAFSKHPWIEQVVSVRNVFPASVTVELKYRRPVALIQVAEGFYAVDAQGVLLPPTDFRHDAADRYIPVTGIATKPRGSAGRSWGDPAVAGAARLAEFLGVRWKTLGLAEIVAPEAVDIKEGSADLIYELRAAGGSRILWGRIPGSTHPGELSANQKLGRLEKYLAEFGSFDKPQGPYEIDIRHWQEISRRSLVDPHANTARGNHAGMQR